MLLFQIFYIIFRQTDWNEWIFHSQQYWKWSNFFLYSKLLLCLSCWTLLNEKRKHVHQSTIVNKYSLTIVPFLILCIAPLNLERWIWSSPWWCFCQDLSYDNIHIKPLLHSLYQDSKPRCSNGHVNKIPNMKNSPAS